MDEPHAGDRTSQAHPTTVQQTSDRELVVTRTVKGPVHLVWEAWTQAELFRRWWVPRSYGMTLLSCEMDVRVGGQYRLVFPHEGSTMAFFGTYLEVIPQARLVWTNEEGGEGETITTVTFEARGDTTLVVVHDLYPSAEAVDTGAAAALPESLNQLDELLATLSDGMVAS